MLSHGRNSTSVLLLAFDAMCWFPHFMYIVKIIRKRAVGKQHLNSIEEHRVKHL